MARIKVLIDRIGADRFLEMVDDELAQDWAKRDFSPERLLFLDNEEERAPARRDSYAQPGDDAAAFTQFASANVRAQKQQGFSTVEIKITRGDLTPAQFHGIADLMREYCGGNARTSVQQNMVLRWVRDESLYEVYSRLVDLGLAEAGRGDGDGRGELPRHRQLQARHHELDGAEPRHPGARDGPGRGRSAGGEAPHQDERLPE